MAISVGVTDLLNFLWGEDPFDPNFAKVVDGTGRNPHGITRQDQGTYGSAYYGQDPVLGREYYLPVTISYEENTSGSDTATLKVWELPNPLVSITHRKFIVETPLTERRGTVKELIQAMDYEICIRGFMVNKKNELPEGMVKTLALINELNVAVSISNPITDIFLLRPDRSGSDQVVIRELRLPEVRGIKHVRPYELYLVSDEPFNLIDIS
jgi:hypothetical protein